MDIRTFAVKAGNASVGAALVALGFAFVPVPGIVWLLLDDAFSSGNRYMDDGPTLAALLITLVVSAAYVGFVVPAIWRRRASVMGALAAFARSEGRQRAKRGIADRKRLIAYVASAATIPAVSLVVGALWVFGDRQAMDDGEGSVAALCAFVPAVIAYAIFVAPAIAKHRFTAPPPPRDPLDEAFGAGAAYTEERSWPGVLYVADPVVPRYTIGGIPGHFWEDPVPPPAAIVPPHRISDDDPVVEVGPELEIDLAQIERWERGEEDPPAADADAFAPTERAIPAAIAASVLDGEVDYDEDAWFS